MQIVELQSQIDAIHEKLDNLQNQMSSQVRSVNNLLWNQGIENAYQISGYAYGLPTTELTIDMDAVRFRFSILFKQEMSLSVHQFAFLLNNAQLKDVKKIDIIQMKCSDHTIDSKHDHLMTEYVERKIRSFLQNSDIDLQHVEFRDYIGSEFEGCLDFELSFDYTKSNKVSHWNLEKWIEFVKSIVETLEFPDPPESIAMLSS